MEIYIIACISFALMYWWNYTREIILTVQGVEGRLCIDHKIKPILFSIVTGIVSAICMPLYAYQILIRSRREYIKAVATSVIRKQHELTE